jgi:hypothetical protein
MNALALMLRPLDHGWAVTLTDGRELARFIGPCARRRALRFLADRVRGSNRTMGRYTPRRASGRQTVA